MLITKCLYCGKEFKIFMRDIRRNWGKFCSRKCAFASKRKKIERICKFCGKTFYVEPHRVKRNEGIYCSHQCSFKANEHLFRKYPEKIDRQCIICRKLFKIIPSRLKYKNGGLFCSVRCKNIYFNKKMPTISSIENKTASLLDKLNIQYKRQYPVEGIALVDFFIKPNIIIQCDGNYWHSLSKQKIRDINQDFLFGFRGYSVLRLTEKEINNFPNKCLYKIRRIINANS
jgi:very-short-patch-repair endonuclease